MLGKLIIDVEHNNPRENIMITKFAVKIIFLIISLVATNAQAAPPINSAKPTLTIGNQKELPKPDPIASTMAKLAIQMAILTKYTHANGKIQSEIRPDGTVGTYLYDRNGRFHGITYSDGRAITAIYDEHGNIQSMIENGTGKKVIFAKKAIGRNAHDKEFATALAIVKGKSVLIDRKHSGQAEPVCEEFSPTPCDVEVPGTSGGGGWSGGGLHRIPPGGGGGPKGGGSGGGGGGGGGEGSGPDDAMERLKQWSKLPELCKVELCVPAAVQWTALCKYTTLQGRKSEVDCDEAATKFYVNCAKEVLI